MPLKDLQKSLKDKPKKIVFGSSRNLKLIKLDRVKELYISNNCSPSLGEKLNLYSSFSALKIEILPSTSEELAVICEKDFPISVVGVTSA